MVTGGREVDRQRSAADRPRGETGDPQVAPRPHREQGESERSAGARDLRDDVAHATTTVAFAAWPAANT